MGKSENFKRIFDVIQSDKAAVGEECKALIENDLSGKLKEYFDLSSPPTLDVVCVRGKYRVTLSFEAERVKNFKILQ